MCVQGFIQGGVCAGVCHQAGTYTSWNSSKLFAGVNRFSRPMICNEREKIAAGMVPIATRSENCSWYQEQNQETDQQQFHLATVTVIIEWYYHSNEITEFTYCILHTYPHLLQLQLRGTFLYKRIF